MNMPLVTTKDIQSSMTTGGLLYLMEKNTITYTVDAHTQRLHFVLLDS